MASEPLEEKKQALALQLAQKRKTIEARALFLKEVSSPKEILRPVTLRKQGQKGPTKLSAPIVSSFSALSGPPRRLPQTIEVLGHSRPKTLVLLTGAFGLFSAAALKSLFSSGKKKAKKVPLKTAKLGVGLLLLKWLLGVSQPVAKHYVTKQIKRQIQRKFGA